MALGVFQSIPKVFQVVIQCLFSVHFDMYTGWTNLDELLNMHDLGFLENGLGITASATEKA